jgi:hypothetical protein
MTKFDADREWSQDELRAHVVALGVTPQPGEVLPRCVKWCTKPQPLTEADVRWAKEAIAKI